MLMHLQTALYQTQIPQKDRFLRNFKIHELTLIYGRLTRQINFI